MRHGAWQVLGSLDARLRYLTKFGLAWCNGAGDNEQVAAHVAEIVGIANVRAALRPEDKLAYVSGSNGSSSEAGATKEPSTQGEYLGRVVGWWQTMV